MTTTYPASKQTITNYAGTALQGDVDHADLHSTLNDTIEAVQDVLGTTAGTSVLKNLSAGDFVSTPCTGAEVNTGTALLKHITPKALADSVLKNYPQGFPINYKIVPSVASNNLTVAIKGLDGNDPSATNPVHIRIGDVVQSITAACSITRNAGTNWLGLGSAETATIEQDQFLYVVWSPTDNKVCLIASRIPYARRISDFVASDTSPKGYNIAADYQNPATTHDVEVVGRFAATLSAGAGYTWSVPTYTTINLIQKPIYESRWLTWAPTFGAGGSMTYTSTSVLNAQYKVSGNSLTVNFGADGTTGGTANVGITATLPFASANAGYVAGGAMVYNTANESGNYYIGNNSAVVSFQIATGLNWGLGENRKIYLMTTLHI